MKQLRYIDYDCESCGASCTRFVYFDTETRIPLEQQTCLEHVKPEGYAIGAICSSILTPREMAGIGFMAPINKNNGDFSERERERLQKRADDHWKRQGKDEAIDRERAFLKKQGVVGGVR